MALDVCAQYKSVSIVDFPDIRYLKILQYTKVTNVDLLDIGCLPAI